jgi:hypothetical protein
MFLARRPVAIEFDLAESIRGTRHHGAPIVRSQVFDDDLETPRSGIHLHLQYVP